jgi:hypothetical protein
MVDEGEKTKEYLKEAIKSIKGDPPDRIARNVDSAVSKLKSANAINESDGILSITSKGDASWESI